MLLYNRLPVTEQEAYQQRKSGCIRIFRQQKRFRQNSLLILVCILYVLGKTPTRNYCIKGEKIMAKLAANEMKSLWELA